MNGHEVELDIKGLTSWQEKTDYLAERFCQDANDRMLIDVETYDCTGHYDWSEMQPQGQWGEYVTVEAFRSVAERFLLAMELIHEMEKDDAE
jgi:hypothetical protein